MTLFSEFVSWQNYTATEQARLEVEERKAEARLAFEEARSMVKGWGPKDRVTVAKAEQKLDKTVAAARQDVLNVYAHRKMAAVMFANCERSANLLSRELSRRTGGGHLERRQNRWAP